KADIEQDLIQVDGRTIRETQDKVYYVLYKPAGCVTTLSDPEDRPTIKTYLEHIPERVYPVGRLDYDVEGALIVTNDGALAFSIMHPRFGVRRTYLAKVHGMPAPGQLERLQTRGTMGEEGGGRRAAPGDRGARGRAGPWAPSGEWADPPRPAAPVTGQAQGEQSRQCRQSGLKRLGWRKSPRSTSASSRTRSPSTSRS